MIESGITTVKCFSISKGAVGHLNPAISAGAGDHPEPLLGTVAEVAMKYRGAAGQSNSMLSAEGLALDFWSKFFSLPYFTAPRQIRAMCSCLYLTPEQSASWTDLDI